jgi:hypothetical protein
MAGLRRDTDGQRPLERFKPTTGAFVGYAGLGIAAFAVVYCAVAVHTVVGLRIALAAMFAAVVVWVSQLRPRATAYPETLLLRGSLQDTWIPYRRIEEVALGHALNIWADGRRYVCIGIGLSLGTDMRARAKKQREPSLLSSSRAREFSEKAEMAAPDQTAMGYHTFVVTRIEELVEKARKEATRSGDRTEPPEVRRSFAVPEIVALVVTGVAFVVTLFL